MSRRRVRLRRERDEALKARDDAIRERDEARAEAGRLRRERDEYRVDAARCREALRLIAQGGAGARSGLSAQIVAREALGGGDD